MRAHALTCTPHAAGACAHSPLDTPCGPVAAQSALVRTHRLTPLVALWLHSQRVPEAPPRFYGSHRCRVSGVGVGGREHGVRAVLHHAHAGHVLRAQQAMQAWHELTHAGAACRNKGCVARAVSRALQWRGGRSPTTAGRTAVGR